MSRTTTKKRVVLAICPTSHGFGFTIFESPHSTLDWGRKIIWRDKNDQTVKRVRQLIDWYHPEALVLPDIESRQGKKSPRMLELVKRLAHIGKRRTLVTAIYCRQDIRAAFSGIGARTKHDIALAIAEQMPEFELWLPQKRKAWSNEDPHMCIFDAASLAFAFFHFLKAR